jgi:hypothetical protein
MDDGVDIDALIAEEELPESVRETLEAVRGQRLAVVTLVTNPEAEAGELPLPEPEVKTLRLWDMVSGQEIPTSLVLAETVHALAFSPDGSHLAAAISDEYVVI